MYFTGIAQSGGGLAHYNILQEKDDLFQAILIKYDGRADRRPPANLVLVRGNKHWSGSVKDQHLLDQLGAVIDIRVRGRLYSELQKTNGRENRRIS